MSGRRVLALYGALIFGFAVVVCRLFRVCSDPVYAARAAAQSTVTLTLPARRGNFYDCSGQRLTGLTTRWMALCIPGEDSYARLFPYADAAGQAELYRKRNAAAPFLLEVDRDVSSLGVLCWPVERRYPDAPLAVQLIGCRNGEGKGAAGLEAAFDTLLTGSGEGDTLRCTVNAQGKLRTEPELQENDSGAAGVQLTLSREIQQTAQAVAEQTMESGCILVLETDTAKIRACVSLPDYDPENVSASLETEGSPLVERALRSYAVGSVFKPVLAAAALEAGQTDFVYTCPGWCEVDGQIFRCAGGVPHGEVDLAGALEKSCNGYFIRLGQLLGAERVHAMAQALGFGRRVEWAGTLHTAEGGLPDLSALKSSGAYANFCFGQGELLAAPVQVAGMMNAIACGGVYRTPQLVEGEWDEDAGRLCAAAEPGESHRALSEASARALRELLAGVVERGTGREAALPEQTAAGKTGTAQTGQFEAGQERKNHWFAGYFPADVPRYTIVVLQDARTDPACSSAAIFARVAAGLEILTR